jgi:hypothetical protein
MNISPKKTEKNHINVNCVSHTEVENLKQFAFKKADNSRVVRRPFWLIKVVTTWKKFGKRWYRGLRHNKVWKWKCIKFVTLLWYKMIHGQQNIKLSHYVFQALTYPSSGCSTPTLLAASQHNTHKKYTDCIYSASWLWGSKCSKSVQVVNRNKLKTDSASCWSYCTEMLTLF